jgi:RNA polymerase sigma-70 factor (ECF subfamily)
MNTFSLDKEFDTGDGELTMDVRDEMLNPEERIIRKQKIRILREIVDQLKPRYKNLVVLRYFREYSYEEIAEETELPIGTVKA